MLTARDEDFVSVLCRRVRILSIEQLARTWWSSAKDPLRAARNRVTELEAEGLIHSRLITVHPELRLVEPICAWEPSLPRPDLAAASQKARTRWKEPPTGLRIVSASAKAVGTFGGIQIRQTKRLEQTHDLHLAAVYLLKRSTNQLHAESWRPEESIRSASGPNTKLPDAVVGREQTTVIDFVGRYTEPRLEQLHDYCQQRAWGYEFW